MSENERNTGKLVPIEMTLSKVRTLCPNWAYPLEDERDWREALGETYDDKYVQLNGKWYEVVDHRCDDEFHRVRVEVGEDGVISFDTFHYNGGAHWTEVVEAAMEGE